MAKEDRFQYCAVSPISYQFHTHSLVHARTLDSKSRNRNTPRRLAKETPSFSRCTHHDLPNSPPPSAGDVSMDIHTLLASQPSLNFPPPLLFFRPLPSYKLRTDIKLLTQHRAQLVATPVSSCSARHMSYALASLDSQSTSTTTPVATPTCFVFFLQIL